MRTTLVQTINRINLRTSNHPLYMILNLCINIFLAALILSFIKEELLSPNKDSTYLFILHNVFLLSFVRVLYTIACCTIYSLKLYTLFKNTRKHENKILRRLAKSGSNLKDPRVISKISESFRRTNAKKDKLFLAKKKSEHKTHVANQIEDRELLNKLHEDLRKQEHLNSLEVKRIHDEYKASKNK
jgi:hypothetical protein